MSEPVPLTSQDLPAACYIFKHSTTCPVSAHALAELRAAGGIAVPIYRIDVREQRDLSDWVARQFRVRHESPQLILIRDGKADKVWNHWEISKEGMKE
jgi:bacillithiol system protein YtxJ